MRNRRNTHAELRRYRGLAMVLVMIALTVGTIITLTFLSSQTTSTAIAHNAARQVQARAIAEDGMRLVIEHIRADTAWRDGQTHGAWTAFSPLNDGGFRVLIEDEDDGELSGDLSDPFVVTVEGRYDGVVHRVSNHITPRSVPAPTHLLLVVGDANLTAQDQAKKALFESWGYSVVTIVDTASESEYWALSANASVAYISEEAFSFDIASRLYNRWIGVVNEEAQMYDEMGMANSRAYYSGSTINISNNTHPITAGLPLGDLQIASSSTDLVAIGSNAQASGAAVLATHLTATSYPTLAALDIGDTMIDGEPAPNRRVTLPIGGDNFDINQLNTHGRQLVRQAIAWAAAGDTTGGLDHYWPLNETSGVAVSDLLGAGEGTFTQGPALGQPGLSQTAVTLAADAGDRITLPASVLDGRTDFTLSAWFKTARTDQQAVLSGARSDNNNAQLILLDGPSLLAYYFGNNSGSRVTWSTASLADDQWHHLVLVRNQTLGQVTAYVDGVSLGTVDQSLSAVELEHLVLGEGQGSVDGGYTASQSFGGSLDEVRVFARALTAGQVLGLYEQATVSSDAPDLLAVYDFVEPTPVTPNLVAHWPLDGASGRPTAAAGDGWTMVGTARVDAYDSSSAAYNAATAGDVELVVNSTAAGAIVLSDSALIQGNASVGPGGDPATGIVAAPGATITGSRQTLANAYDLALDSPPAVTPTLSGQNVFGGVTLTSGYTTSSLNMIGANVTVDGDVTLVVEGPATILNTTITLTPGSSFTLWVENDLTLSGSQINADSTNTSNANIYLSGSSATLTMLSSTTAGRVVARNDIVLDQAVHYGGLQAGGEITLTGDTQLSIDQAVSGTAGAGVEDVIAGNDGILHNNPTLGAAGRVDGAYEFDGVDDFVEVPHTPAYLIDQGSLAFWFRPNDVSGTQTMVAKDAANFVTGGHIRVYLNGSRIECRLQSTTASHTVRSASGVVSAETWHHVIIGFGAGGLRMYLDGNLVDSGSYAGGLGASSGGVGNQEPWAFGVDQWQSSSGSTSGWNLPYHGRIDDVRIYDRNLDADQAADLFALTDPRAAAPAVVYDTAGAWPAHDLAIADPDRVTWISGGGLTLDAATSIASGGPVDRLHAAVVASDELTVEAVFTPANVTQDGPARIVTYSNGTNNRNFHLGQTDQAYNVRLRTEFIASGLPAAESGNVLTAGTREHVVITYDNANEELRVYRNGNLEITQAWSGDLDNWDSSYQLLLGNETSSNRAWLGTLHRVAIYDGAFNGIQADNVFNGNPPGDGTGGEDGLAYEVEWLESP